MSCGIREYLPLGQAVPTAPRWTHGRMENGRSSRRGPASAPSASLPRQFTTTKVRLRITGAPVCPAISTGRPLRHAASSQRAEDQPEFDPEWCISVVRTLVRRSATPWMGASRPRHPPSMREACAFPLIDGGIVRAKAFVPQEHGQSAATTASFGMAKARWKVSERQLCRSWRRSRTRHRRQPGYPLEYRGRQACPAAKKSS